MARSNSLQLKANLLKKALIFSAFFYVLIFTHPGAASTGVCPPQHIDESARVDYVYDGDTIKLEDGRKIRLLGIDTPEIFSRKKLIPEAIKAEGEAAKVALQKLLNTSRQRVSLAYGQQRFDRYRRTLAHVFLTDGTNLQAALISQGHAIAFTTPPNDRMSDCYQRQEAKARKRKQGVWALEQYQLKTTSSLSVTSSKKNSGFQRIEGKVSRVWQSKKTFGFILDDKVEVRIFKQDLNNFNAYSLNNLVNKKVRIRGWLHVKERNNQSSSMKSKKIFTMNLRHPDAIKVLN